MGWNRLIEVRWLCGMSNERLPCWHNSFHTSAKLRRVSRKLFSFSSSTWLMQTMQNKLFIFFKKKLISCHQAKAKWYLKKCLCFKFHVTNIWWHILCIPDSVILSDGGTWRWGLWINYRTNQYHTTQCSSRTSLYSTAIQFTALK